MGGQSDELAKAIAACVRRDRSGLRAIFDQESGRLLAVAQRILRRRELAEEVLQEALIRIWTHAHQYAPDQGSAKGWIYAIVRNRALNALRDGKREQTVDDVDTLKEAEHSNQILTAWHQLDQKSQLRDCLQSLDKDKRDGILMAYVGGYTHGEIAGRLQIPLGTAKSWVRRGLSALRACMT